MLMSHEERAARLARAAHILGGKSVLGRRLGYASGAFVGQMIRGTRPITEKTLQALARIPEVAALFADKSIPSPPAAPKLKLADALPVVLEAIAACPERDELRQLLPLLVTGAHGYRERITELLTGAEVAPGGGDLRRPEQGRDLHPAAP